MDEMKKVSDEALENVTGGASRTVYNDSVGYAHVRTGPGKSYESAYDVYNGDTVYTTGAYRYNEYDGYVWYQLTDGCWIAGSLIGY